MTSHGLPHDLAARLFRALYTNYDLHVTGDIYVAVPQNVPCYSGRTLSEIVRQVSSQRPSAEPGAPAAPSTQRPDPPYDGSQRQPSLSSQVIASPSPAIPDVPWSSSRPYSPGS
jgi:hypothetical protein